MKSGKSRARPTVSPGKRGSPDSRPSRWQRGRWMVIPLLILVGMAALVWVRQSSRNALAKPATAAAQPSSAATPASATAAAPAPTINANRAMSYVRDVVGFGPRFLGSPGHKRTEVYIRAHLKGVEVEDDFFTASTPVGPLAMRNIIAKFPGTKPGVVVIATHYDTLYGRKDFVGANDGGSGTGLLLELANQLRGPGRSGRSVWLVWLDGEEAIRQWSATDSLYGSRHLAQKWKEHGSLGQIQAFLLADMIGDADLNVDRDQNSTPWLEDVVYQAASALGFQSHFFARTISTEDDHLPFVRAGVPVADLIDFDYGYDNSYWHTSADTLDKLSPRSLEIVGDVLLETVALLDRR